MASNFILTLDVFSHIFDIEDKIALAFKCELFRRLCVNEGVFRKLDLSRHVISTTQRVVMNNFFRERRFTQHVRELDLSNLHVLNWQMDDHLQKFIVSICPQLEILHVVNCGVSLQTLQRILQKAPQLTSLSWSTWDFTSEETEFLSKCMESSEGMCFKNIKHLHLHMNDSFTQIHIAKYLVLSCCRDLEEIEIYTWCRFLECCTGGSFPVVTLPSIPDFPWPSVESELQHLHSLVLTVGGLCEYCNVTYSPELYRFLISVLSRKSSSTEWKKVFFLPSIRINREHFSHLLQPHAFHSVEAITVEWSQDAVDELKTLFEMIGNNTLRRLHLSLPGNTDSIVELCNPISIVGGCFSLPGNTDSIVVLCNPISTVGGRLSLPGNTDAIVELCNPISRVGGHSLEVLHLSTSVSVKIRAEQNVFIRRLFSNCSNITELDLHDCKFEKDICKPLSELKHLTKVQLRECAISSKYCNEKEISKANLLIFVENCKKITHLDVRRCRGYHRHFSCLLSDDDLLALAILRNLKSLTLYRISGVREWTFLKNISENCKFLTTLRITAIHNFNSSHIPILMESSRFLKHLAIDVPIVPVLGLEDFWDLLSHAKNLERLCIKGHYRQLLNIPLAVEMLKSLPRLHVLHLHNYHIDDEDDFYCQMIRMLEEKESDCRFSFEIVLGDRKSTWINHPTGYSVISNKALPLNKAELCFMKPILNIPRF